MNSEIICVGTELLMGDVVNTNASFIARHLAALGINCYYHTVVGDNPVRLEKVIRDAFSRSDLVILTGGLGPTYDDLTKETVAKALGLELVLDAKSLEMIKKIFSKSKQEMTENNIKQAYVPKGSRVLTNHCGTAPGVLIEHDLCKVIMLPGPPTEMKAMFEESVLPYLVGLKDEVMVSHRVYLFGIGESKVESLIHDDMLNSLNPTIAPYAGQDGLHLRITAKAKSQQEAEAIIKPYLTKVINRFDDYVYSVDIPSLEKTVAYLLEKENKSVYCIESTTGGLLGQRIASESNESTVFKGAVVVRTDNLANKLLSIDRKKFNNELDKSKEMIVAMLNGATSLENADYYLAVGDVSGFENGDDTEEKGAVWIGLKDRKKDQLITKKLELGRGYSDENKRICLLATSHALKLLIDSLNKKQKTLDNLAHMVNNTVT